MTVAQLIEKLGVEDPQAEVSIWNPDLAKWDTVEFLDPFDGFRSDGSLGLVVRIGSHEKYTPDSQSCLKDNGKWR
jgi:hypothetical protein